MSDNGRSDGITRGLVLTGGGARGAYQVGVLKGLAEILPKDLKTPFPVITGTSAGAINAAVLASHGDNFQRGVERLVKVWGEFETSQIYRSDWATALRSGLRWFTSLAFRRLSAANPKSLLDNSPLRELLLRKVRFEGIDEAVEAGHLLGVGITVSGYTSARSITVCQARKANFTSWERRRRIGVLADINVDHLMASSAMPFIFPAVVLNREYCGDGVMRESAPLSPAIHLGANRLFVIGVRNEEMTEFPPPGMKAEYPTFSHIMGYMLDTLFMDSLYTDLERLKRINQVLDHLNADEHDDYKILRHVDCDVIVPSCDLREIAKRHADAFPTPIKLLLSGMGTIDYGSQQLMSYLLFESAYTKALIEIGYRDTLARKQEFLGYLL